MMMRDLKRGVYAVVYAVIGCAMVFALLVQAGRNMGAYLNDLSQRPAKYIHTGK